MTDNMTKKQKKQSLTDSIFGGGLTDGTGIFGKPTSRNTSIFGKSTTSIDTPNTASGHPPKKRRRKRPRRKKKEETQNLGVSKTPWRVLEERRKKYSPPDVDDDGMQILDNFALVREQSTPGDVFAEEINSTIKTYGLAVVRNVIDPEILKRLQQRAKKQRDEICKEFHKRDLTYNDPTRNNTQEVRFQEVVVRCKGRMDARYRYHNDNGDGNPDQEEEEEEDPNRPCNINFWADHTLLHKTIGMILYGEENTPKLVYSGWIFSWPGSDTQPWHQDGIPLFPGGGITPTLPPYAINVFIPLTDVDGSLDAGPTEFVVGSHRMEVQQAMEATTRTTTTTTTATKNNHDDEEEDDDDADHPSPCVACPVLKQGDILLYDYRICHRGTSNLTHVATAGGDAAADNDEGRRKATDRGGQVRSILYLMYARPWFQEHLNFGTEKLFNTK